MLIVVGGHSRSIGKTSVASGLISALQPSGWTAAKITQHGHGICSIAGQPCDCAIDCGEHYAITEETASSSTDSGRFLAAGAVRSLWVRTAAGDLGKAMPELNRMLASSPNVILESNSVLEFVDPDLYIVVVDTLVDDVKASSRRFAHRADAFVSIGPVLPAGEWAPMENKPVFRAIPPLYVTAGLVEFVTARMHDVMPAAKPRG